jgi:hypothetical protein
MGGGGTARASVPRVSAPVVPAVKADAPVAKPAVAAAASVAQSPMSPAVLTAKAPIASPAKPLAPTAGPIAPPAKSPAPAAGAIAPAAKTAIASDLKDSLLSEIRAGKPFFYNTVVAQAKKIDVAGDRVTFTFLPTHRALREQFEQSRSWLESTAERVAGRRVMVEAVQGGGDTVDAPSRSAGSDPAGKRDLKADAMNSSAIQAVLDVFPAEIRDVEEMEP